MHVGVLMSRLIVGGRGREGNQAKQSLMFPFYYQIGTRFPPLSALPEAAVQSRFYRPKSPYRYRPQLRRVSKVKHENRVLEKHGTLSGQT
jgi:hypothetical protein